MRRQLLWLQHIHQLTEYPYSFFSSRGTQKPYLATGFTQQVMLLSGGKVEKRKLSSKSSYRSCFTDTYKTRLCSEGKRVCILFHHEDMLTLKEQKCWFPVPVPQMLRILCMPQKRTYREIQEFPPLQALPKH